MQPAGAVCGSVIRLDADVLFAFDEDELDAEGSELVDRVAALLVALGSPPARVEGHTDSVGPAGYNETLSERRTESVQSALVAGGVRADSLAAQGFGETRPLHAEVRDDGTDDPGAHRLNRRVEIVLLDA
ncbi:MAG: OmpA family protein [Actinomycetota bacterium]